MTDPRIEAALRAFCAKCNWPGQCPECLAEPGTCGIEDVTRIADAKGIIAAISAFLAAAEVPSPGMSNVAGDPIMAHHVVNAQWTLGDHLDAGGNIEAEWAKDSDLKLRTITKTQTGIFVWRAMLAQLRKEIGG